MHDMMHQVILSIASNSKDGFLVRCRVHLEGWPNVLRQPYKSRTLTISESELLLLSCTERSETMPPALILNKILDLKVVDIRRADMSSILLFIVLLKSLQTLRLERCNLESVHVDIGELQELMILSFCGSSMEQLPAGLGKLSNLRLLDVTKCKSPQRNTVDVAFIPSLAKLEEVYMRNRCLQWGVQESEIDTNSQLQKLLSLGCLTALEMILPMRGNLQFCTTSCHFISSKDLRSYLIALEMILPMRGNLQFCTTSCHFISSKDLRSLQQMYLPPLSWLVCYVTKHK